MMRKGRFIARSWATVGDPVVPVAPVSRIMADLPQ